jgi:thioredoxin reductase (NADPH)
MQPDILIIGGGPAAMTAGLYSLRGGHSVTLLEKENFGGQIADSPRVENFPSLKSISGLELSNNLFEQITSLGANYELDEALSLKKEGDLFTIKGNFASYSAKAVIIATGVKHRHLGAPGEDRLFGHGVSYCAVCDGPFYAGKDVLVIGDANSALQYALLLAKTCHHVDVVTLFDKFFAEEALVKALLSTSNITITHNMNTLSFNGEETLSSVSFENTKTKEKKDFKCEGAFVAIGQIPDAKRFEPFVQLNKGYIVTDESMKTLTPGLFAAGDIRDKKVRQLVTAANDGAIASLSAGTYLDTLVTK